MTARSVGVLGSLCNPPHLGHLLLASEAAWQLGLDQVLLVPTGIPPHRDPPPESPELRTRLAAALVTCDPVLELCRLEVDRPGPAYTADTLEELAASGIGELVLLLGADQLAALHTWHEPDRVRAAARIAVAPRPGTPLGGDADVVRMPELAISSSEIRRRVGAGEPIRPLVPDPVRELVERERLYRPDAVVA
jgi:nicotinate-nucleotide adenylyltransferase